MTFKLAVITDWGDKKSAFYSNKDGILKAFSVLRDRDQWELMYFRKHPQYSYYWDHDYIRAHFSPDPKSAALAWKPDAVLFFCDFSRPIIRDFAEIKIPKAQCYTGGRFTDNATIPDIVFTESKSYIPWMKEIGVKKVVQAFGTNTELFQPMKMTKFWDGFFPAVGAAWKRHHIFAEALGSRGLACGWWQPNEQFCLQTCLDNGCAVMHHQTPESLVYLYNMSRTCVVPSSDVGGSQRTVLEALACNIPLVVASDSTMTTEYVLEAGEGAVVEPDPNKFRAAVEEWKNRTVNTRPYIMENYSEWKYADKLRDGILSIV
jgi:glycosyltransferase involved in cell wall biosynthesis